MCGRPNHISGTCFMHFWGIILDTILLDNWIIRIVIFGFWIYLFSGKSTRVNSLINHYFSSGTKQHLCVLSVTQPQVTSLILMNLVYGIIHFIVHVAFHIDYSLLYSFKKIKIIINSWSSYRINACIYWSSLTWQSNNCTPHWTSKHRITGSW